MVHERMLSESGKGRDATVSRPKSMLLRRTAGVFTYVSDTVDRIAQILIQFALAAIVLLVLAEVIARNVVGTSFTWVEEVSMTFVGTWFVFIGASHALRAGMLISFDFLLQRMSHGLATAAFVISQLAIMVFLVIVIVYGMQLGLATMRQPSPALQLPMGIAYTGIVAGCALMALHTVTGIINRIAGEPQL